MEPTIFFPTLEFGAEGKKMDFLGADANATLAALSGASPTTYFVWKKAMESAMIIGKEESALERASEERNQPQLSFYNDLHGCAFQNFEENELSTLVEGSSMAEINKQDHNGCAPIHWAVSEGNSEVVSSLVDQGCDINIQNFEGETPLLLASARGNEKLVQFLVNNGANPHIANLEGVTPMHLAAANGRNDILSQFIEYCACLNVQDHSGDSLLHYAVREGHLETIKFLVKEGNVTVDIKNEDEETPLDLAECLEEAKIIEYLSKVTPSNSDL
eukprot:TRINITY_DN4710_c0_g1_i1.p2 TRINITY_DN4710_c0_g1~~TRINITY_DN4710_c0_g1_i1.p2  ORF type:complete len:274 (-),score=94.17 TRINITY_DN4710_c0_g1_i1:310-1131(-)